MAKLFFKYGAMNSGKSTALMQAAHNYEERGMRVLVAKPMLDTKGSDRVVSRLGVSRPVDLLVGPQDDLLGALREDIAKNGLLACLLVDEAQFLTKAQVQRLVEIVDDDGIPVVCYGLRADFRGELFEGSQWLLAWADTIEEVKTVCWCGKKATWNARISDGRVLKEGEQIVLGGNESYTALCRKHWREGNLGPQKRE